MIQIAPSIAAVLLMLLGGATLLFTKTMAAFVGLGPITPVSISEIRSTLGSSFWDWKPSAFGCSLPMLYSLECGFFWSGDRAAVRSIFDHSITVKNIDGVVAESR
ncbi:hypothetical protein NDI52_33080 [Leptolyngbya sp. PL-A3]